jgi:poly(3-hydroxybutyrate) depolymerase
MTGKGGSTGSRGQGGSTNSAGQATSGGMTSSGGRAATGGSALTGGAMASSGTGGLAGSAGATVTGGSSSGAGGTNQGGSAGTPSGGSGGSAGGAAGGPTAGSGGSGGGPPGLKNPPVPSPGCGKALATLKSGSRTITSSGSQRDYTIDIPADYDMNHPYRLFFTFHWIGASDDVIVSGLVEGNQSTGGPDNYAYYGLKRQATMANDPAIFIAPSSMGSMWNQSDHPLFDDLLALAKENLCIDTTRVFATGFSFGGMITYSLSTNHQKDLRAVVGIAPANYNIYLPTNTHEPIPYMSTTGMGDTTCPWDGGSNRGAKYAALAHAMDNGCTIPSNIPTTMQGSKAHVCYDFEGCKAGFPVKACTFDGGHQASVADGGTQNNGLTSWIPTESWKFFTQF